MGGVTLRQDSNFRENFVTNAVNNPQWLTEAHCVKKEGGNQERKISFRRRLLTCGIQAFAQCQVTTTHSSKQREGHSHSRGSGVRTRLSILRLKNQEEFHSKRGHGQGIYPGAQTISGDRLIPHPPHLPTLIALCTQKKKKKQHFFLSLLAARILKDEETGAHDMLTCWASIFGCP